MRRIEKPWGYEVIWAETAHYVAKLLFVREGHKLSRQYHRVKEETFYLQQGKVHLELGLGEQRTERTLVVGDEQHVPPRLVHRMFALEDSLIFEVSTPHLDDVVRIEDDYGRGVRPLSEPPNQDEPRNR